MRRRRNKPDTEKPSIIAVIEAYFDTTVADPGSGHTKISCVFHEDNNPSASINVDTNHLHCFSCQWSGDSYDLIQHAENVDFKEAQQVAAERFGTTPPTTKTKTPPRRVSILNRDSNSDSGTPPATRRRRPRLR